ncbi:hypothetical protein [Hymenobacter sp. BT190]|uniref:hypothetical protein n=1 Tax=Hymenobacter sp. BT190 TaxID=2763505 RepID=UPI0016519AD6|nr:hypothetical protein [Hymenobacter sp. BT190]MBC6699363.1 hypothetical protein [Hymenobacter sp. BT190]
MQTPPKNRAYWDVYVGSKTVQNRIFLLITLLVCIACARPVASIHPVQVEVRFPACILGIPAIEYVFINPNSQPVTIHSLQAQIGLSEPESISTFTNSFRHSITEPQRDRLPEELLVPAFGRVQIQSRFSYLAQFEILKDEQYRQEFSAVEPRIVFPNPQMMFTTCE